MNPRIVKKKPPVSPLRSEKSKSTIHVNSTGQNVDDLQFNINDDYKTLVKKNTKLRGLLVNASDKINELVKFNFNLGN
jgi:hypothetical protein